MFAKPRYRTAAELQDSPALGWRRLSEGERRARVSIGVIDDKPFDAKQNLENLGYRVEYLGDPHTIQVVVPHHIILCDLQGVGKSLDPKKQGAFLIDEIKRNYPEKFVIAYTGGMMSQSLTREAMVRADYFLRKDANIDEWRDRLDAVVGLLVDPVQVWFRYRKALIDRNVDTLEIIRLEDAFVSSVFDRRAGDDSPFARMLRSPDVKADVRALGQNLVASGLFHLVVGA